MRPEPPLAPPPFALRCALTRHTVWRSGATASAPRTSASATCCALCYAPGACWGSRPQPHGQRSDASRRWGRERGPAPGSGGLGGSEGLPQAVGACTVQGALCCRCWARPALTLNSNSLPPPRPQVLGLPEDTVVRDAPLRENLRLKVGSGRRGGRGGGAGRAEQGRAGQGRAGQNCRTAPVCPIRPPLPPPAPSPPPLPRPAGAAQ